MNDPAPGEDVREDTILMADAARGDTGAFEALVLRHQHSVVGTVAKMLGDPTEAEDIAQQVFVRVWKSAARYQPSAKFTTWLMTITRNLVFNEMRRRGRAHLLPMETGDPDAPERQFPGEIANPGQQALDAELSLAVESAIASLPEPQRTAIILRRFQDMPYEEIAVVLKTTPAAVKSLLFRARAELKEKLKKYLD